MQMAYDQTRPVRTPRVCALVNGTAIDSIMHMEITARGSCKASQFDLTIATDHNDPRDWLTMSSGVTVISIFVRAQATDCNTAVFEGLADTVSIDPLTGNARIQGRDYSSVLADTTFQQSFVNQTASQIARSIAIRHGLNANVNETSTMVGSYLYDGYNQIILNAHSRITSEWDMLTYLAPSEGFELFVQGTTLVFAPRASLPTDYFSITKENVKSIKFHRRCPLSKQTRLVVKSWNSWLSRVLVHGEDQTTELQQSNSGYPSDGQETEIAVVRPNLTSQDAERLVRHYQALLNEQQLNVDIIMPGELRIKPFDHLTVRTGTSGFDADYIVKSVRRQYSSTAGFVQHVSGFTPGPDPTLYPASAGS